MTHLVQVGLNTMSLMRHYRRIYGSKTPGLEDKGYLVKTGLTDCFVGDARLRPWRFQNRSDEFGDMIILGYSQKSADELKKMLGDALPELAAAFDTEAFFSRPLRSFEKGERLQLQASLSMRRNGRLKSGKKAQRDVYVLDRERRERNGLPARQREEVYGEYAMSCFKEAVSFAGYRLSQMRTVTSARKTSGKAPDATYRQSVIEFEGVATIEDPELFRDLLLTGIGRDRCYGNGMVLVRAAA